jgi:hypothetical protein
MLKSVQDSYAGDIEHKSLQAFLDTLKAAAILLGRDTTGPTKRLTVLVSKEFESVRPWHPECMFMYAH